MTLENLNGTKCTNNTVYITEPSTVAFICTYAMDASVADATTYVWTVDNAPFTVTGASNVAYIAITGGTHYVTCAARVAIEDIITGAQPHPDCVCTESTSYDVIVVGK